MEPRVLVRDSCEMSIINESWHVLNWHYSKRDQHTHCTATVASNWCSVCAGSALAGQAFSAAAAAAAAVATTAAREAQ